MGSVVSLKRKKKKGVHARLTSAPDAIVVPPPAGRLQLSLYVLHVEPGGHMYELSPLAPSHTTLGGGG